MPIFQRGGIEQPPPEYRTGPTQSGHTQLVTFPTREEVTAYCQAHGIRPDTTYAKQRTTRACYLPDLDVVAIIEHGQIPDDEWQEEAEHEWGHARGWRHNPNGRGTAANSLRPRQEAPATNALTGPAPPLPLPTVNALRP